MFTVRRHNSNGSGSSVKSVETQFMQAATLGKSYILYAPFFPRNRFATRPIRSDRNHEEVNEAQQEAENRCIDQIPRPSRFIYFSSLSR